MVEFPPFAVFEAAPFLNPKRQKNFILLQHFKSHLIRLPYLCRSKIYSFFFCCFCDFASGPFIKSKIENTEFYCLYTKKNRNWTGDMFWSKNVAFYYRRSHEIIIYNQTPIALILGTLSLIRLAEMLGIYLKCADELQLFIYSMADCLSQRYDFITFAEKAFSIKYSPKKCE